MTRSCSVDSRHVISSGVPFKLLSARVRKREIRNIHKAIEPRQSIAPHISFSLHSSLSRVRYTLNWWRVSCNTSGLSLPKQRVRQVLRTHSRTICGKYGKQDRLVFNYTSVKESENGRRKGLHCVFVVEHRVDDPRYFLLNFFKRLVRGYLLQQTEAIVWHKNLADFYFCDPLEKRSFLHTLEVGIHYS